MPADTRVARLYAATHADLQLLARLMGERERRPVTMQEAAHWAVSVALDEIHRQQAGAEGETA